MGNTACLLVKDGNVNFYDEVFMVYTQDDGGHYSGGKIFEGRIESEHEFRVVMKVLGFHKLNVMQKSIFIAKQLVGRPDVQQLLEEFSVDDTPKGWLSIEDYLPQWIGEDVIQGYTEYRVKDEFGESITRVTDHELFYIYAKEVGITHWLNE